MIARKMLLVGAIALSSSSLALADARVSVAHFAPFADTLEGTSVSVYVNGTEALPDVRFKDFTPYLNLPAGETIVDIVPTGSSEAVMTATYNLVDGKDYTVYATGNIAFQPLELVALEDDNSAPAAGNVKIRIVHTAPFGETLESTEVSIRTAGGDLVADLQGVSYGIYSDYLELPAGEYDLKVASNDGQVNYIDPLPVELPAGAVATLFAVGDIINQDLAIIATPLDELPLRAVVGDSTNGAYYLDALEGQGFWFTPIPAQNRVIGSWYTYNTDGTPMWFTFDSCNGQVEGECTTPGEFDGMSAATTLYQSTGETMEGGTQMTVPVGTIDFDVIDCSLIKATVTVGDSITDYDGIRLSPSASCPPQF